MGLNTEHKVTLTEGQIGIILCSLEDSINNSNHTRSEGNEILQPFDSYCQAVGIKYKEKAKMIWLLTVYRIKIRSHIRQNK